MSLATLSIDLVAKLASLEAGLDKAGRLAQKQADAISSSFAGIKLAAVGIGAALGAAFSVAGITGFIRATIDGLDALNDFADATGTSIEMASALEDVAARTGTSFDTVQGAVLKLNKVLSDAEPGTEAANVLKLIGLNAEELKRLDPAEALRATAVALAGFTDDGKKARIVQELFGKSTAQVAPLLNDLAAAGALNGTATKEQAKAAEDFNKQLANIQKNATDAARQISGPLITALNGLFDKFKRASAGQGVLASIGEQFKVDLLRGQLQATNEELERLAPAAQRAGDILNRQPDSIRAKATLAEVANLRAQALRISSEIDQIEYGGGKRRPASEGGGGLRRSSVGELPGDKPKELKPEKVTPFVIKLDDVTAAALKRLQDTSAEKIAQLRLELQALIELRPEGGSPGSDSAIATLVEELTRLDPAAVAATEAKRRLDAILAQTPQGALDDVLVDIQLLNAAFESGQIAVEQWADGVRVAAAKLPDAVKEPLEQIDEFSKQAAANIQDALGDGLLQVFEGNTKGVEDIFKNMLKRLVAQATAAQLGSYLFGDNFGSKGGSLGGIAGSLLGFFTGLPGKATGGPVSGGRPYIIGERGPELFIPRGSGNIVPNDAMGGSGGASITLAPVIRIDARSDAAQVQQLVAAGMAQAQQSMWRQLKARGIA